MEDDKSTDTSVDDSASTGSDDVDTSTNDDQDTDIDLEDIEVSPEDIAETNDDDEEAPAESTEEVEDDVESEEQSEDIDEESTEEDSTTIDEQKRRNDEFAKQRIAEREARKKAELAEAVSIDRYLQEAKHDEEELAKRQLQVDAYALQKERVQINEDRLQNGLDKAIANIDILRDGSPEVKEALLSAVDDFEAMHVVKDAQGNPVEVRADIYEYLQTKADSIRRLTGVGARQNQKDKQTAKTRTITPPSKAPKPPKVDPDLAAFEEEADKW